MAKDSTSHLHPIYQLPQGYFPPGVYMDKAEKADLQVKYFIESYGGDPLSKTLKEAYLKIYGPGTYHSDAEALQTILAELEGLHWLKDARMRGPEI